MVRKEMALPRGVSQPQFSALKSPHLGTKTPLQTLGILISSPHPCSDCGGA